MSSRSDSLMLCLFYAVIYDGIKYYCSDLPVLDMHVCLAKIFGIVAQKFCPLNLGVIVSYTQMAFW